MEKEIVGTKGRPEPDKHVMVVKFLSGEEVIGKVSGLSKSDHVFTFEDTLQIQTSVQNGKFAVGLFPWGAVSDNVKDINAHTVVYISKPSDQMLKSYTSMESGLVLPPEKTLLTEHDVLGR